MVKILQILSKMKTVVRFILKYILIGILKMKKEMRY